MGMSFKQRRREEMARIFGPKPEPKPQAPKAPAKPRKKKVKADVSED